jgi:hypothetical protein
VILFNFGVFFVHYEVVNGVWGLMGERAQFRGTTKPVAPPLLGLTPQGMEIDVPDRMPHSVGLSVLLRSFLIQQCKR